MVARRDGRSCRSDHRSRQGRYLDRQAGWHHAVVSTTSFVVRDNEGSPLYLIVVIEDITERKKSEAYHMAP